MCRSSCCQPDYGSNQFYLEQRPNESSYQCCNSQASYGPSYGAYGSSYGPYGTSYRGYGPTYGACSSYPAYNHYQTQSTYQAYPNYAYQQPQLSPEYLHQIHCLLNQSLHLARAYNQRPSAACNSYYPRSYQSNHGYQPLNNNCHRVC